MSINIDDIEILCMRVLETNKPKEIEKRLKVLFKYHRLSALSIGDRTTFWRARKLEDRELFTNISELTCPPKKFTGAGRINDPKKPVLYISTRKETALAEINVEEGDSVQLAGLSIRDETELKMAVVGMYWSVSKNGSIPIALKDPNNKILGILNQKLSPENALKLVYIDKFFATVLADKKACESNYIHTRVLSKMLMQRNNSNALAYPSIKDEGAYNITIKAEVYDSLLENTSSSVAIVTKILKYGLYVCEVFKMATDINKEGHFIFETYETPLTLGHNYIYNQSESDIDFKKYLTECQGRNVSMLPI